MPENIHSAGKNPYIRPTQPASPSKAAKTGGGKPATKAGELSFQELLQKERSSKVNLSAHAQERLERRDINLEEKDWQKISEAVDRAAEKGVSSSLLVYGDVALVASVTNRTIITAVDETSSKEHVFTGIDGAVIVE